MIDLFHVNPKFGGSVSSGRFLHQEDTLVHIIKRTVERYKLRVSIDDVKKWNNAIIHGLEFATWRKDCDDLSSEYVISWKGYLILVLFSVPRWTIVTALPKYRLKGYQGNRGKEHRIPGKLLRYDKKLSNNY